MPLPLPTLYSDSRVNPTPDQLSKAGNAQAKIVDAYFFRKDDPEFKALSAPQDLADDIGLMVRLSIALDGQASIDGLFSQTKTSMYFSKGLVGKQVIEYSMNDGQVIGFGMV